MIVFRQHFRLTWVAIAAIVGASFVTGSASAACTSMPAAAASPTDCCCEAPESARSIPDANVPATSRQFILSQNGKSLPEYSRLFLPSGKLLSPRNPKDSMSKKAGPIAAAARMRYRSSSAPPSGRSSARPRRSSARCTNPASIYAIPGF